MKVTLLESLAGHLVMKNYLSPTSGPFHCARGLLAIANSACMQCPLLISVPSLVATTKEVVASGSIDNLSYLNESRVFLLSGRKDSVVV